MSYFVFTDMTTSHKRKNERALYKGGRGVYTLIKVLNGPEWGETYSTAVATKYKKRGTIKVKKISDKDAFLEIL